MPTVLPFHRAVVSDPAFTTEPFSGAHPVDRDRVRRRRCRAAAGGRGRRPIEPEPPAARERITVEVGGKRLEVVLPPGFLADRRQTGRRGRRGRRRAAGAAGGRRSGSGAAARRRAGGGRGGDALVSPMQGTIVKIVAADGQQVSAGDTVVVLEAMKMEQPLAAHKDGTVGGLAVEVGQTVSAGAVICQLRD